MKNFTEFQELQEGISPIVFHATDIHQLKSMIGSDTFNLRPVLINSSDDTASGEQKTRKKRASKLYFMSTARNMNSLFIRNKVLDSSWETSVIEFDGRKLATKLSGTAIDYWGPEWRDAAGQQTEQEDRLHSEKPDLKSLSKYIKKIHLFIPLAKDWKSGNKRLTILRELLILLKQRKIPVAIYRSPKDLVLRRNEVKFDIEELKPDFEHIEKPPKSFEMSFLKHARERLSAFLRIFEYQTYKEVMRDKQARNLYRIAHDNSAILHRVEESLNELSASTNTKDREIVKKFVNFMRKNKLKHARDFSEFFWKHAEKIREAEYDE